MFTNYPLTERVQQALAAKGFDSPTPIQAQSLPHTLQGKDLLGQARTGTGKTLAFGLPIATRLEPSPARGRAPRAFILTPTRELALQVASELEWLAPELAVVAVYGGTGYSQQAAALKRGSDIVVATPGRALDYLNRRVLSLAQVEVAVLDEADEMLSMGFEKDVEALLAATPAERQTLLFSATLPAWAKRLAREVLRDPVHLDLISGEDVLYEEVTIEAPLGSRVSVLSELLHLHQGEKAIIFTRTKAEVDALARELAGLGHGAEAIHGDLNQSQRERVLSRFRSGHVAALIGTDVAARGLDIPEVDLVIHYRLPNDAEGYQHRSGRTGRAGRKGTVVLLHGTSERRDLLQLERAVSRRFRRTAPPSPEAVQDAKLVNLLSSARKQRPADKAAWRDVARGLLDERDEDTLAGLLALLLGGAPAPRSLLTGEEDWVTLELPGDIRNPGQAMRLLKDAGAGEVGRIQLHAAGVYADVRPGEQQALAEQQGLEQAKAPLAPEVLPARQRDTSQRRRVNERSSKRRNRSEARY